MRLVVVLFIIVASRAAWAQPPSVQPAAQAPAPEPKSRPYRSPALAGGLSLTITAAGLTTLLVTNSLAEPDGTGKRLRSEYKTPLYLTSGLLLAVGPSSGHIYAGKVWNGGLAVRLVSGAIMVLALGAVDDCCSEGDHGGNKGAAGVAVAAGLVYLGASIYEIAIAPRTARRFNARHASPTFAIAPMLSRDPGIALVGRF